MLYDGLPDSARSKNPPGKRFWGEELELLAQLVEEVSVLTADQRRKEPLSIPRPWADDAPERDKLVVSENGATHATGHHAMLAAAQMRGAVRLG